LADTECCSAAAFETAFCSTLVGMTCIPLLWPPTQTWLRLVLNTPEGLVVITGCGHTGIVNILTFAREQFANEPVEAVIGGLHLFPATDNNRLDLRQAEGLQSG
jgi:hypothetical protein